MSLLHWAALAELRKSHEPVHARRAEFVRAGNIGTLEGNVIPEVANRHDPRIEELAGAASETKSTNTGFNSAVGELSDSWHRCLVDYRVDPKSGTAPNVVTQTELRASKEPVSDVIAQAREEIDRLYAIVRQQEYVVLLCNKDGVAIHHRGDETRADDFKHWGIWLGGIWSEQIEGTNGIGTCITEQRPVLVHCRQHYRSRHSKLTCAGAPIFDALGRLAGVLDVSAVSEGPDRPQQLALAATVASARAVEERLFREYFRHAWVIAAVPTDETTPGLLLAIDEDQRIIGADRAARAEFRLDDESLAAGARLSALFEFSAYLFRKRGGQDVPLLLTRTSGHDLWRVLLTPPLARTSLSRNAPEAMVHSRSRLSMLSSMPMPEASSDLRRGGLAPVLKTRICEFIEEHIGEKISLDALSSVAGLSPNHFARAFQQSVGLPPHRYLLRRRLEHVEQMLRETQLPLSQIALAVGFSDQSHLARHFRRLTGVPPSLARRWS